MGNNSSIDNSNKKFSNSCYGATNDNGNICNTCNDVVNAYKSYNWAYDTKNFSQCDIPSSSSYCYGADGANNCNTCNRVVDAYKRGNYSYDPKYFAQCDAMPPLNAYSDYIKYDNLLLTDGSNKQETTNRPLNCAQECVNDPNCRGVNIIMNTENKDADGYDYEDTKKVTCEYVNNICYSNTQTTNPNSTFLAKKYNLHFENNTPYLLKNNGVCLTNATSRGSYVGWDCNGAMAQPLLFGKDNDMISLKNDPNRCLATDNDNSSLTFANCNEWNSSQKFIYDHVYHALRPLSDTTKCVTTTNIPQDDGSPLYHFGIAPCDNPTPENNTIFENYYITDPKEDNIEYFENDYSVDMGYYITYMILLCMIAYLVIVSSSKK